MPRIEDPRWTLGLAASLALACTEPTPEGGSDEAAATEGECPTGIEGCPCSPGGDCFDSLVCVEQICVDPGGGMTTTTGDGDTTTTTSDGDTTTGDGDTTTGDGDTTTTGETSDTTTTGETSDTTTTGDPPNPDAGKFELVQSHSLFLELDHAVDVEVSPDDAHVYVAARDGGQIGLYDRDPVDGTLTLGEVYENGANFITAMGRPVDLQVSADGDNLYVVSVMDDSIVSFARNPATGAIVYLEHDADGDSLQLGLEGAFVLAISPDDQQVYVGANTEPAITVFERDLDLDGRLSWLQTVRNNADGVNGLDRVRGLALSPDGANLYAGTWDGDSVVAFTRDEQGTLSHLASYIQGQGGVTTLTLTTQMAVSPDGEFLYVCSFSDGFSVFARDPVNGELSFVESHVGTLLDAEFSEPSAVHTSSDGDHVYAVGTSLLLGFLRGPGGSLSPIDEHYDAGEIGVTTTIDLSHDDANIYTANQGWLLTFSRQQP